MINEFIAKKMGEVLAFNQVGTDTFEKGRVALAEILGAEKVADIEEKNALHTQSLINIANEAKVLEITSAKAEKTNEKLKKMRDLYVADQWDNATELMEWSGFFEGAAIVHWQLVLGAAETLEIEDLSLLAQEGVNWHHEVLEMVEGELYQKGADRATK